MSDATWLVLADSSRARIFGTDTELTAGPEVIDEFVHPAGRMREGELASDGGTAGSGRGPRSATPASTLHEHGVEGFAQHLARHLSGARHQGLFSSMVLVAPPAFLGLLRAELDKPTLAVVRASIDKSLSQLPEHQVLAEVRRRIG